MARIGKLGKLAEVLREFELDNAKFTIAELAVRTGYTENSIRKYIHEKLNGFYIHKIDNLYWKSEGIKKLSNDEFYRLMSQTLHSLQTTPEQKFYYKLIKRSLDSFTLALEIYNRPTLENRVESFCILAVNSWELLLKAEILKTLGTNRVFEKNGNSITLTEAINLRLQENDPVRKNLETLTELRNMASHLLIKELQPQLSRLFQSTVLNYQLRYKNEMGNSPLTGQSVGMLSLVVDGPNSEIAVIKDSYGELTASIVSDFLNRLTEASENIKSAEFSIPIEYKLTLSKNKNASDVNLNIGDAAQKAILINVPKDPTITHPYYEGQAIIEINQRQDTCKINGYKFRAVIKKHQIKNGRHLDMHYEIDKRHRYSDGFINWFVKNLQQPNWIDTAVKEYKK
ncbi:DUF3644 domain-containing protein [Sodalis sp. RH15]|uniref:DUF3644 domain-containing protein n=1 Tax=Sodalis sp. RH15 TaxID=3394330 RepID=UPI0039B602F2